MTPPDPSAAEWQTCLRQRLCEYRFLPDPMRQQLHERMRHFLATISFESPDRITLTDEMKILIAGHACLTLTGGIGEYSNLKNIHVYRREFRLHDHRWITFHEGPDLHLAWDKAEEGMTWLNGWNPALFRFAEALLDAVGWRGQQPAFERWLDHYKKTVSRSSASEWQRVDLNDANHALQYFAQAFFETPEVIHAGDSELYGLLREYFQTDPLEWKTVRRKATVGQPLPEHWTGWLEKIRFYNELPPETKTLLHQHLLVLLDETDFRGDRRLEVTEEMKVSLAGQACFLLLGPHHEAFANLSGVTLSAEKSRYLFQLENNQLKLSSEKVQADLTDPHSGDNCVLQGFSCFLDHPKPSENMPALPTAFAEYERRKREQQLHAWEWGRLDSIDHFFRNHLVYFFEQPFDVQRDLPGLYDAFRDFFGLDPLALATLEKEQVPFQSHWRKIMRDKIGLYKILPKPDQAKLEELIPQFLGQVEFIPQGYPAITEEMQVCVAAEACILVLGRGMDDYRHLQTVEIWKGNPEGKHDTAGDAHRSRVRLNWEKTLPSALVSTDNYNIVIHEFAHVIDFADDGEADSIPLPANAAERRKWEELVRREQSAIRRSRWDKDKHLIREYGAKDKAEFFTCATEAFFEKSTELKRDHAEIYEILENFYQLNPAEWRQEN